MTVDYDNLTIANDNRAGAKAAAQSGTTQIDGPTAQAIPKAKAPSRRSRKAAGRMSFVLTLSSKVGPPTRERATLLMTMTRNGQRERIRHEVSTDEVGTAIVQLLQNDIAHDRDMLKAAVRFNGEADPASSIK
ncbi:hypothetical protein AB7813_12790 [Tardiphaga sp. 20_F10_N6_6]|uniref:hypothetical protein n=1 Tax=Tardiphaga sp. 20_F10_N6_6 TaxID=3240788 RepID=UPI003F8B1923